MKTALKIVLFLAMVPLLQHCSKSVQYNSNTSGTGSGSGSGSGTGSGSNGTSTNNPAATPYSAGQAGVPLPVDTTKKDTTTSKTPRIIITINKTIPCSATGETFDFIATGVNIPTNATYTWYVGDGTIKYTSTVSGYKYIYPNSYHVVVQASYNAQIITKDTTIKAYGSFVKPTASFYITQPNSSNPNYVALTNQTSSTVNFKVSWDLGDGTASTDYGPTHTYPTNTVDKVYRILLTATGDSSGCKDTISHAVNIVGTPATPSCIINYNQTDSCGPGLETFNFGALVTGAPAGATYNWDFGDNSTSIGASAIKQYTSASNFLVKLTISNSSITCSKVVKAFGINNFPTANFYYTVNAAGNTFNFYDSTITRSTTLQYFFWNYDDGVQGHVANTTHTYVKDTVARTYNVLYGIKTTNNCSSIIQKKIIVPSL